MSARNRRHGRGRRAEAKMLRRAARDARKWFDAQAAQAVPACELPRLADMLSVIEAAAAGRFDGAPNVHVHVRADGTVVVTETATAPDCTYNARRVNLEPR